MGVTTAIYGLFRQCIVPIFLIFGTLGAIQFLSWKGNPAKAFYWNIFLGNCYSWTVIGLFIIWAIVILLLPSKQFRGPPAVTGYVPQYQDNGFFFYLVSTTVFLVLEHFFKISLLIFENFGEILATLNIIALLLCVFLWGKGKVAPTDAKESKEIENIPKIFEFYRGMEIHPRILGMDVKQLTNCRIGLMLWQLLILAFFFTGIEKYGLNYGFLVNILLQTIYLAKFFWSETAYFNTLDITLDRAGYYICWGCLVVVPCFYTFTSYYFVVHLPGIGAVSAGMIFILGVLFIFLNYIVDNEKELFRTSNGICMIWGKQATYLPVEYTYEGKTKKSKLLTSGFWGLARHFNYTFELLSSFCWAIPGVGQGPWPFLYFMFLAILLTHRIYRDEDKCKNKYGSYWNKYCKLVPFRLVPLMY